MKIKLLTLFFLTFALFSAVKNSFSQSQLYAVMPGDTLLLSVTGGNGTIQWQESIDSLNWSDLTGANANPQIITTIPSGTGKRFFRAKINDPLCPLTPTTWYSSVIRCKILTNITQVETGNWFHGGIVYYVDGAGNGLIAPPIDQGSMIQWGCSGTSITGATSSTDGATNTSAIVAGCSQNPIAAKQCSNFSYFGYTDWYLPAITQLEYLYQHKTIVGGFTQQYWSSTEFAASGAYNLDFNFIGSTPFLGLKTDMAYVRCIRSFISTENSIPVNIDASVTGQPLTVSVSTQPNSQIKCLGSNVTFTVSAIGTAPITYQWKKDGVNIPGAINSSYIKSNLTLANEGIYTCDITNLCRTISSNNAQLNVIEIISNAGLDARICNGQNTQLQGVGNSNHAIESGTLSYSWSPSTGLNLTNVSNPVANPIANTTYTLNVTDQRGCTETDQINVVVGNVFQNEEICLVTVDTITWKNKIMWEKTTGVGTSNYIIYKEIWCKHLFADWKYRLWSECLIC